MNCAIMHLIISDARNVAKSLSTPHFSLFLSALTLLDLIVSDSTIWQPGIELRHWYIIYWDTATVKPGLASMTLAFSAHNIEYTLTHAHVHMLAVQSNYYKFANPQQTKQFFNLFVSAVSRCRYSALCACPASVCVCLLTLCGQYRWRQQSQ